MHHLVFLYRLQRPRRDAAGARSGASKIRLAICVVSLVLRDLRFAICDLGKID